MSDTSLPARPAATSPAPPPDDTTRRWSQMPPPMAHRAPGNGTGARPAANDAGAAFLAWVITAVGPVVLRWHSDGAAAAVLLAALALPAAAAVVAARRRRCAPAAALGVVALVALGVGVVDGAVSGVWLLLSGALAVLVVGQMQLGGLGRPGPDVAGPTSGVATVSALVAVRASAAPTVLVALCVVLSATVALLLTRRPDWAAALRHGIDRAAAAAATVVSVAVAAVLALPTVLLPWAVQRAVRWDPLWVPRRGGTRWVARRPEGVVGADMGAADPRLVRSSAGRALHRTALLLVLLVMVLVTAGLVSYVQGERADEQRFDVPALADAPWSKELGDASAMMYGRAQITSFVGPVLPDVRSPMLNVDDGARRTWEPPTEGCAPLRIWMFGGSAAFGEGQRDGHTIASELARAAWGDGVALDVTNLGVGGDTHWMEVRRLELALAERRPLPDLVVFYGGANDWRTRSLVNGFGQSEGRLFPNDLDAGVLQDITRRARRTADLLDLTRPGPTILDEPGRVLQADQLGRDSARSYTLAGHTGAALLEDTGIPRLRFSQPIRAGRTPMNPLDFPGQPADEGNWRSIDAAFRADLPNDVVDLSGVFDGDPRPIYWDDVHTNELGARLVAEAMWPEVRDAMPDGGAGTCR